MKSGSKMIPSARDRQRFEKAAVVGVRGTRNANAALAPLAVAEVPEAALRRVGVRQARMRREILRRSRLAELREIGGRRATDELGRADLARDEILAADRTDAHRGVEPFVDEIDDPLRTAPHRCALADTAS